MEKIEYAPGLYYEGSVLDGKRNGYGKLTMKDGNSNEGFFVNDLQQGNGIRHMTNGQLFYASWKDGKCHGVGQIRDINKEKAGNNSMPNDCLYVNSAYQNVPFNYYDSGNLAENSAYAGGFRVYHRGMSAFILETPSATIVIDWNQGIVPKLRDNRPVIILYSHIHQDHFSASALQMLVKIPNVNKILIGSDENGEKAELVSKTMAELKSIISSGDFEKIKVAKYSEKYISIPEANLKLRYIRSNDMGLAYLMEVDGKTFLHSGDLAMHNYVGAPDLFETYAKDLYGTKIDYAMIGGAPKYTIGDGLKTFKRYNEICNIQYFTPCHLWMQYEQAWKVLQNEPMLLAKAIGVGFDSKQAAGNLPLFTFYQLPFDNRNAVKSDRVPFSLTWNLKVEDVKQVRRSAPKPQRNIDRYARVNLSGIGGRRHAGYGDEFSATVYLSIQSKLIDIQGRLIESGHGVYKQNRYIIYLGNTMDTRVPLYIVHDAVSDSWYEYFTFQKVIMDDENEWNRNTWSLDAEKDAGKIEEIAAYLSYIHVGGVDFISPGDLDKELSRYSEDNKRLIASKVKEYSQLAKDFEKRILRERDALVNEKKQREGEFNSNSTVNRVNAGMGAYADNANVRKSTEAQRKAVAIADESVVSKKVNDTIDSEDVKRWKRYGLCQHCGGEFKGIVNKKCRNCGRDKDYKA